MAQKKNTQSQKQGQNADMTPESNDREAPHVGIREDGTAFTNEENDWPAGTVGPHGHPARESERQGGSLPAESKE